MNAIMPFGVAVDIRGKVISLASALSTLRVMYLQEKSPKAESATFSIDNEIIIYILGSHFFILERLPAGYGVIIEEGTCEDFGCSPRIPDGTIFTAKCKRLGLMLIHGRIIPDPVKVLPKKYL